MLLGKLTGPIMMNLEANGRGIAIVDGVSLRIEWAGKSERLSIGDPRREITLQLTVTDVLDEEQQRQKIARLERELTSERDKLEDMKAIFDGSAHAARDQD